MSNHNEFNPYISLASLQKALEQLPALLQNACNFSEENAKRLLSKGLIRPCGEPGGLEISVPWFNESYDFQFRNGQCTSIINSSWSSDGRAIKSQILCRDCESYSGKPPTMPNRLCTQCHEVRQDQAANGE